MLPALGTAWRCGEADADRRGRADADAEGDPPGVVSSAAGDGAVEPDEVVAADPLGEADAACLERGSSGAEHAVRARARVSAAASSPAAAVDPRTGVGRRRGMRAIVARVPAQRAASRRCLTSETGGPRRGFPRARRGR